LPQIAVGVIFRLVFAPDYGILNILLGGSGHQQILWLSTPALAMLSVATVDIWQWTPFVYLVLFAGLQAVPPETVEAAQVDGAGVMRRASLPVRLATYLALAAVFIFFGFPLLYLVSTSLKPKPELFVAVPTLLPVHPSLDAYSSVLIDRGFIGLLVNSVVA